MSPEKIINYTQINGNYNTDYFVTFLIIEVRLFLLLKSFVSLDLSLRFFPKSLKLKNSIFNVRAKEMI